MLDQRDSIIQATVPVVMVPRFSLFEPLSDSGHRFLAANDGLSVNLWKTPSFKAGM